MANSDTGQMPVSVSGKDGVHNTDGKVSAPANVIPNEAAARVVYDRLKHNHTKRCWNYERIQGMIDGNPPYNPQALRSAGIGDMTNVNWKDGDALYRSVALAYWSLFNDVETMIEFKINIVDDDGINAEWGKILSEEWDRVVRSWPNFTKHMSFHQGEMLKFGLNAVIWPDERDWRFKPVNAKRFLLPDQTDNDTDAITTVIIEHQYTAQFLWGIYDNLKDNPTDNISGHWDKKALGEILWQLANIADKDSLGDSYHGCCDIQKRIRNGDVYYDTLYNDDIILVSILQKEYDEKVSHIMIHRSISTNEFPFFFDRQYEKFREATLYFSFQPGEETVHGNKGLGHSIFSAIEALTQLDCSVLDQGRRAGSLLLKGGPSRGRDERQIRFVHGGVIDIGEGEIAQNTMGNNISQTVDVSRYFKEKVYANNNISGQDPASSDRNVQSVRQFNAQATKEAKVQKNMIAHYYEQLDYLFREVVRKMLHSTKGKPGYDYVRTWKERCINRGVSEQLFTVGKAPVAADGLPVYMEVYATRSAGSGSQIADQIEMQNVMQILPTLGERGRQAAISDYIASFRGHRYVNRYFPEADRDEQPTGHDTIASIENNQFSDGKQVIVSPDNNHIVHMTNHMRIMKEVVKAYQENPQAEFDRQTNLLQKTDEILQVVGPHFVKHLFFASQDTTRAAEVQRFNAEWAVIANFGDMISANAATQREAEMRKLQAQEEELARQNDQNTPEHIKARGDIALKQEKLTEQIIRDRKRDRFKFLLSVTQLKNSNRLAAAKAANEIAIMAAKELKDNDATGEVSEGQ